MLFRIRYLDEAGDERKIEGAAKTEADARLAVYEICPEADIIAVEKLPE